MSDVETFYCLIVGSRSFSDYELFVAKCDLLLRNWGSVVIVSGGARGADALAKRYAVDRGYCYMEFPADWDTYGDDWSEEIATLDKVMDFCLEHGHRDE